ncbi:WD40/YVTN/BNR-like repeat-containing protein [Flavilitoribacter nigricans]|uniref:Glycosyl hydrolase n=1 Tax=Flavilitoribacter nigricans (strain ATCC 23147 / DSM 23189 / NBRC 102662 / NCIMB 1420 / SS-2) TaxID=1122177 RepID=A0A2D0N0L2_FLAN2|nr:glycosyl hydrolase [Flavilitoribacter nigricans]PHN02092.1 glycosyl hydrolase [Flavilitoribacter nigricans DSM 23189 = NBRC 102662]
MRHIFLSLLMLGLLVSVSGQRNAQPDTENSLSDYFQPVKWRNIGPFRGGRSVGSSGVVGDPLTVYMGTTGGGLWKTEDAGQHWANISDGYFQTGSVGAVAVSESDPRIVYVGMGEHAVRGVMTSYGDGVYKSYDAGKSWTKMGLELTRQIAGIAIHPQDPNIVYVAAQGALNGPNEERGVYKSEDGGKSWKKVLYVDARTGCADISMDMHNPQVLYAVMWEHQRLPWKVISGGPGSGLYKSTDGGENWEQIENGLPEELGKMSVSVSRANPEKVYALVESDTEKEQGGLFASEDGGASWSRVSKDHRLVQRAWYYIEVFADPQNEHIVYVLNAPALKSIDGGKSWTTLGGTHGDYHDLWIDPDNNKHLVISNDGGAAISFNQGNSWSTQDNMPTAQFYRVNVDNRFPYRIYGGQQDNSSVVIASRTTNSYGISERDWNISAGGESAFLAFDPDNPRYVLGGSYQGAIEALDNQVGDGTRIMSSPIQYLAMDPKDMKYRFNWNAPIIWSQHEPNTFYHGGNILLKTQDLGNSWQEVSPDLTRNEIEKQGKGGGPYTNEGAGGENYGTLSYVVESPHQAGVIWAGSDDGLVSLTLDNGAHWDNVTPRGLQECLINAIEVSPHDPGTAYIATTRYKFNDFAPGLYKTTNYGESWTKISDGIPDGAYTRVVREDQSRKDLLYAGTELGLYISYNGGRNWTPFQLNLPIVPITDLIQRHDDLIAATQGRSFWVLDNLDPIRQYNASREGVVLYQPEPSYRVGGGSEMDSNGGDGKSDQGGVNPPTGVVIYYQLPDLADSSRVELIIRDAAGDLVRKFSTQKDPDYQGYPGSPAPDPTLSKKAGLNRFVWNMRYPTLQDAPQAYIEGSYRGHKAIPGSYSLELRVDDNTESTSFEILSNPNIEVDDALYQQQHEILQATAKAVNEMHTMVNELGDMKQQIKDVTDRLESKEAYQELVKRGRDLVDKITTWDGEIIQRKSRSYDDVINFPNKLSAEYLFLRGQIDDQIPIVTRPVLERLQVLDDRWAALKSEALQLKDTEVKAYNQALLDAGLGPIIMWKR